jgi:hypothetical protein
LEVAVANLQEYCNGQFASFLLSIKVLFSMWWWIIIFCAELENRLLARFDSASQRRELSTMAECAKILSQVCIYARNRVLQHADIIHYCLQQQQQLLLMVIIVEFHEL